MKRRVSDEELVPLERESSQVFSVYPAFVIAGKVVDLIADMRAEHEEVKRLREAIAGVRWFQDYFCPWCGHSRGDIAEEGHGAWRGGPCPAKEGGEA